MKCEVAYDSNEGGLLLSVSLTLVVVFLFADLGDFASWVFLKGQSRSMNYVFARLICWKVLA